MWDLRWCGLVLDIFITSFCSTSKPLQCPFLNQQIYANDSNAIKLCVFLPVSHSQPTQSLASLAPTYLTTDIHLVSEYGRRPLRSSTDRTLTVPRTHNRFGDRSFAVAGPRLWNSLPISLRQISIYGQFRQYLKNYLFRI